MSQAVITKSFSEWKAQQAVNNKAVVLDEFVFAYIPDLDVNKSISNAETIPAADKIVHRQAVSKCGVVNDNSVVYSVTLGADVGDFDFNWIGLTNKATGTLAMIIHAPAQSKVKNASGQQGNVLVRSMLMEYSGAQAATEITTPAETWQIDFTARLAAMDERQRLENVDQYGPAAFFGEGYLVAKSGTKFLVTKGAGYVAGLRTSLAENQNITISTKPVKVWLDVSWSGMLTSAWEVQQKFTVADTLADYEQGGVRHFVFALASIDAAGVITDLRPKGGLSDQALKEHEKSRNHPDGTLNAKGFVQLSSATDSNSESLAATPKAVKAAYELANGKYSAQDATTARKGIVQLSSATDSTSEVLAATPKAVKAAYDNADRRVPSTRTVNGHALDKDLVLTPDDIGAFPVKIIGKIKDGAKMGDAKEPGWWLVEVSDAATVSDFPAYPSGQKMYGYGFLLVDIDGYRWLQHYYSHHGANAKRQMWSGNTPENTGWVIEYNTTNKPTAADVDALPSGGTAVAAEKLKTKRTINGVGFDGTANITIPASAIGSYTKAESDARYNLKNTASGAANGWFKDNSTGMIFQWGTASLNGNPSTVSFPVSFPNSCFKVFATDVGNGTYGYGASPISKSQARIYTPMTGTTASFFAIGN